MPIDCSSNTIYTGMQCMLLHRKKMHCFYWLITHIVKTLMAYIYQLEYLLSMDNSQKLKFYADFILQHKFYNVFGLIITKYSKTSPYATAYWYAQMILIFEYTTKCIFTKSWKTFFDFSKPDIWCRNPFREITIKLSSWHQRACHCHSKDSHSNIIQFHLVLKNKNITSTNGFAFCKST